MTKMNVNLRCSASRDSSAGQEEQRGRIRRAAVWVAVFMVRSYQAMVRPLLIGSCKFQPTCSEYAISALEKYGLLSGGWLAFKRILRCHPLSSGGIDPLKTRD